MKMITKFQIFINESIMDTLKGKSDNEILNSLKSLNVFEQVEKIYEFGLPKNFLPTKEELIFALDDLSNDEKIYQIIRNKLDYDLLPRNEQGICFYNKTLIINSLNLLHDDLKIDKLPDNFTINGYLYAPNNNITEFPKKLKVLKTNYNSYDGSIYLSNNKISEIPNNFKVNKNLNLNKNNITKIPNNLRVEGDLQLNNNAITTIGKKLYVGGNLYCNYQRSRFNLVLPDDAIVEGVYSNEHKR